MRVLLFFILATAEYQRDIAGASGVCQPPTKKQGTVLLNSTIPINKTIRIQCEDGFKRKAGTSNQLRCIDKNGTATLEHVLELICIRDPRRSINPQSTDKIFTTSTTKRTQTSTIPGTSMSTAATAFSATNEVDSTQTRTTNLATMKISTKEPISTTNESPSPISSICPSSQYMTTRSSSTHSTPFTTATGVDMSSTAPTTSEDSSKAENTFTGTNTSTIGGAAGVIVLSLVAAGVFYLLWRLKHRATNTPNEFQLHHSNQATCTYYIPVPVSDSEHCSAEPNDCDATDYN